MGVHGTSLDKFHKTRVDRSQISFAPDLVGGKSNRDLGSQEPGTNLGSVPGLAGQVSSTSASSACSVTWQEEIKGREG